MHICVTRPQCVNIMPTWSAWWYIVKLKSHLTKALWANNWNLEKIFLALTLDHIILSDRNFAHAMTAPLSWHVRKIMTLSDHYFLCKNNTYSHKIWTGSSSVISEINLGIHSQTMFWPKDKCPASRHFAVKQMHVPIPYQSPASSPETLSGQGSFYICAQPMRDDVTL